MSDELRLLGERKRLLVAKTTLHRLELRLATNSLRRWIARPRAVVHWLIEAFAAARFGYRMARAASRRRR